MSADYVSGLFGLDGRTAAVTGGGSGIGRRIAFALAAAGANVVLIGRRTELLKESAAEINELTGEKRADFVTADLSQSENIPEIGTQITNCFGAPRVLVNAAGVNLRSSSDPCLSLRDITLSSWNATMAVNLTAPFFLSRELAAGMRDGGSIINIGSMQSVRAGLGDAAYTTSKGGVVQLTKAMARVFGREGIVVNAILPGFFPSDMTGEVFSDEKLAGRLAESTMLGRNGELDDLDGAAVFLASAASSYITGILLPVDGGFLAK